MPNSFPGFSSNNCTPLYFQLEPSSGGSLTRTDIVPYTKATLAALGLTETGMDKLIAGTKEARMAGVEQRSLYDLLLSRHIPGNGATPGNGSIIAPYSLVPRKNVVNALYFHVTAGSASLPSGFTAGASHATWGYIPNGAWKLTISNGVASPVGASGNYNTNLQNIENYFFPGMFVIVQSTVRYLGSNYQTAYTGAGGSLDDLVEIQFKVHAAVNASGTTAYLVVSPNIGNTQNSTTDTAWGAQSTEAKEATQVTAGTLLKLSNSVSDYEQWCYQPPAVISTDLIEYWHQTRRWVHKWNDEYKKALENPNMSDFFKKFRSLPLAQQRAQQERLHQQDFFNTVFFGQAQDVTNQTLANYTNLKKVYDPYNTNESIEFQANTLGIRTQLNACSRVVDKAGGALDLDWLMDQAYNLGRYRGDVRELDIMGDRTTGSLFRDVMTKYYKAKYGLDTTQFIETGKSIVAQLGDESKAMFDYNSYWLPDQGVKLNLIHDRYFDDAIGAAKALGSGTPTKNRARRLWLIDWSDVFINNHGVKSKKRTYNSDVMDKLYNCTMEDNLTHATFNSQKFDVRLGDANRHLVLENFSASCPTVTVTGCTVGS